MSAVVGCASSWFCTKGPDADVVGTNGCSEGDLGATSSIIVSGLGGGGDGDGEWSSVIGVVEMWYDVGSWICGGEPSSSSENSSSIS